MSDYLWDKTGEPDADIEQLENLLGTLKHKQRPLEIPATAIMPNAARPATVKTIFSRPRFTIAASLILMLLAGAWLVTRQSAPQKNQIATVGQGSPANSGAQPATPSVVATTGTGNGGASTINVEQTKPQTVKNVIVHTTANKTQRPSRQTMAARQKQQPRRNEISPAPSQLEEVATVNLAPTGWQFDQRLTPQQREATEQLMLALRLASAKFNYAQREMQEIGRAGK